ncbi:MAG: carbohydrate ABC transporter permease [Acholeplasmataceae bacterium]|nr:carbohydrate ABC transporter permease [Acholeplasmataceae bacterium]
MTVDLANKKALRKKRLVTISLFALMVAIAIILIFPYVFMVSKSLMNSVEVINPIVQLFPKKPQFTNYVDLFTEADYLKATMNSIIVVTFNIIVVPLSASLIAFSFAKLEWKGKKFMFAFMMSTMMLPGIVTQIPLYVMYSKIGWLDTLKPLMIPNLFGGGAIYIFLLRQFMRAIPKDLEEAAKIDGAGTFRIYWQIILPLCKPVLIYIIVTVFIANWGDYYGPLVFMSSSEAPRTLPYLIFLQSTDVNAAANMVHMRMAGSVFLTIVPIILFSIFQKHLIEGIVMTGIK